MATWRPFADRLVLRSSGLVVAVLLFVPMGLKSQVNQLRHEVIDLGAGRSVRLGAVLGKGTACTVYRGELSSANGVRRKVAAKVFSAVSSDEAEQVFDSLLRTAQRTACVEHSNVVQIHECIDWRG